MQRAARAVNTIQLDPLLRRAGFDPISASDIYCKVFEAQCAVLLNTERMLQGAEKVYSLVDVEIKKIVHHENEPFPFAYLVTDLDIVTTSLFPDGTKIVEVSECLGASNARLSEREYKTAGKVPKPVAVKSAFDAAMKDLRMYRIPENVFHVDVYRAIIAPTKGVDEQRLEHLRSVAQPLVDAYGKTRRERDVPYPSVSVLQTPFDWDLRDKRLMKGMPWQKPSQIADLIDNMRDAPRGGHRIDAVLTGAQSYRRTSSPLFHRSYS